MAGQRATTLTITGFGKFRIPVRMYHADNEEYVSFESVHAKDKGKLRKPYICEVCGEKPENGDVLKRWGDEASGYIYLTKDEVEALRPKAGDALEILEYSHPEEVPLIALVEPFYIGTGDKKKGGVGEPFKLLHDAMAEEKVVARVRWTTKGASPKKHYGVLRTEGKLFVLQRLLGVNEVRDPEAIEVLEAKVAGELVKQGRELVRKRTTHFNYNECVSDNTKAIEELLESRAMGKEVHIESMKDKVQTESLADMMKDSLAEG